MNDRPSTQAIVDAIERCLDARAPTATICPSEVARALAGGSSGAWRALMPDVRDAAASLAARGRVRITRGGDEVDALAPGGPIRIGRPRD